MLKKDSNKERILIFDADLIAYRAAAVSEDTSIKVQHIKSGLTKEFKTRTEFKNSLKEKGKEYNPDYYTITDIQSAHHESHSFQIVKSQVNSIKKKLDADRVELYIGGEGNFRTKLELPEIYKGNRKEMLRPILLDSTKKYCLNNYPGGIVYNKEVDDQVVIRYHELNKAGHDPIVITLDKDQKGCVGTKFCDYTKEEVQIIEVPEWGYLEYNKDKKKVQGIGLHFYCYQMLKGDIADNYSPSHLHKKRFGDVECINYLNQAKNIDEIFTLVEQKYKEWFPKPFKYPSQTGRVVQKDAEELLELYHQCVYMQRVQSDSTGFYDLWKEFK